MQEAKDEFVDGPATHIMWGKVRCRPDGFLTVLEGRTGFQDLCLDSWSNLENMFCNQETT